VNDIVGVFEHTKEQNGFYAHSIALIIMGGIEVGMNISGWWMEHTWVSFSHPLLDDFNDRISEMSIRPNGWILDPLVGI
jgi:hypothetical protein